jgi:hypothetical protein
MSAFSRAVDALVAARNRGAVWPLLVMPVLYAAAIGVLRHLSRDFSPAERRDLLRRKPGLREVDLWPDEDQPKADLSPLAPTGDGQ